MKALQASRTAKILFQEQAWIPLPDLQDKYSAVGSAGVERSAPGSRIPLQAV